MPKKLSDVLSDDWKLVLTEILQDQEEYEDILGLEVDCYVGRMIYMCAAQMDAVFTLGFDSKEEKDIRWSVVHQWTIWHWG